MSDREVKRWVDRLDPETRAWLVEEVTPQGSPATLTALRIMTHAGEQPTPNLAADLKSLEDQAEGVPYRVLRVITEDEGSTCDEASLDKGGLTEGKAKELLRIVVQRRDHRRDLIWRGVFLVVGAVLGWVISELPDWLN